MYRPSILLLGFLLIFFQAKPQAPSLYFEKLTAANGLSNNKINCILQDRRGFMWIGTNDGLNRYDGNRFAIFRNDPADNSSISGNIIRDLHEDEAGILWIATEDGGITRYDYTLSPADQFRQYKNSPKDSTSIPSNMINDLLQDEYGYLWLATSGKSVIRFDKVTGKFLQPVKQGTTNILDICLDKSGNLWAGRQGGSILKINIKTLDYEMDERYNDLYAKLPHASVSGVYNDRDNYTWFGSWDKRLFRYDPVSGEEDSFGKNNRDYSFPDDEIRAFAQDGEGRLWMGGKYFGLTIYDAKQNAFFNYQHDLSKDGSIADNSINCFFISQPGIIWIGTNKGVSIYNPAQQPFVQTFLPNLKTTTIIYDFFIDVNNTLWIGTNEGLYLRQAGMNSFEHRPLSYEGKKLVVSKIFRDVDGSIYLGTNFSLFKYDLEKRRLSLLPNTKEDAVMYNIIESRVVSIARDTIDWHPVLLTLPYGHFLAYYDLTDQRWISRRDSTQKIIERFNLKDNLLRKFYKTVDGKRWLATGKFGLASWEHLPKPTLKYYQNDPAEDEAISNNNVYDLVEDSSHNLWISTYGGGLNYFNTASRKFTHIKATNNLLEGVALDKAGHVWMISNGHLNKYDPNQHTNTVFNLPDMEKSGGIGGNIQTDAEGNMYVAGANYYIKFNPEKVRAVPAQPKVHFTDFKIFNNSFSHLLYLHTIRLPYHQNYFTIEFAAPEFLTGQVEYAYMLEGFDEEWIEGNQVNFANYSNLSGGEYTFKVRATNKKGNWAAEHTSLNIVIIPPIWKRWWFFLLCAMAIAGIVYAFYRYRINELIKRQDIRNKIAQDLHDSVGSTLSSVSVYSQVAKIYHAKGSHAELEQVIQKIATTSTDMISEMNDIVWAINPANDSMEKIVQRMESFARPLLQTQEIRFCFEYTPELMQVNLTMQQRKNFYLIFKETVNNVLKYSDAKNLDVSIEVRDNMVEFVARDDGKGFDVEKMKLLVAKSLSGNGLANMKRRAAEMGGECVIESDVDAGTAVRLNFRVT